MQTMGVVSLTGVIAVSPRIDSTPVDSTLVLETSLKLEFCITMKSLLRITLLTVSKGFHGNGDVPIGKWYRNHKGRYKISVIEDEGVCKQSNRAENAWVQKYPVQKYSKALFCCFQRCKRRGYFSLLSTKMLLDSYGIFLESWKINVKNFFPFKSIQKNWLNRDPLFCDSGVPHVSRVSSDI